MPELNRRVPVTQICKNKLDRIMVIEHTKSPGDYYMRIIYKYTSVI